MTTIVHNLQRVRSQITAACAAAEREPSGVSLLAVSKKFGADAVVAAIAGGQRAFGENYIAEGVEKIQALRAWQAAQPQQLASPLVWHCIGPLQSNKTRPVAEHFDWVQSVDRLKIAQRLSEQRPAHLPPLQICLQVNLDGGLNKSGVSPDEALVLARAVAELPRLALRGLMSIPEPAADFAAACAVHLRAKELFEYINGQCALARPMDTLSMGMTGDLAAAIHAGSTMVRVGTAIFGSRAS